MNVHPTRIPGRWREGYALDQHPVSSEYLGDDEYGHARFETTRSEIGESLYLLKYKSDVAVAAAIADAAASFVAKWRPGVDLLIPVPPTRQRNAQPVMILGEAIAKRIGVPFAPDSVRKVRDVPE